MSSASRQSGQNSTRFFQAEDTDMPISTFPVKVTVQMNLLEQRIQLLGEMLNIGWSDIECSPSRGISP